MKLGLLAAGLALVAGGAVGCGGGDSGGGSDAPSTKEFCGSLADFQVAVAADSTKDPKAYITSVKDAATKVAKVGTPDGMPADAKDGFELTVHQIEALPDDATVDDLTAALTDASAEDQKKLDALDKYVAKSCPELS
jgi:hypothetical protein